MKIQFTYLIPILFVFLLFSLMPTVSVANSTKNKSIATLNDPTRPDFAYFKKRKTNSKSKKNKKRQQSIKNLVLQQTFISQFKKIAIINGASLIIGEMIRGAKLIKIETNYVVLQHSGKLYKLQLTLPIDIQEVNGN